MLKMQLIIHPNLVKALHELPEEVVTKMFKSAARRGAQIVAKAVAANAESMVGGNMGDALADAIQVQLKRDKKRGSVWYRVGFSKAYNPFFQYKAKSTGYQSYIPSAIEFGHIIGKRAREVRPFEYVPA